jgi:hypothetical protein
MSEENKTAEAPEEVAVETTNTSPVEGLEENKTAEAPEEGAEEAIEMTEYQERLNLAMNGKTLGMVTRQLSSEFPDEKNGTLQNRIASLLQEQSKDEALLLKIEAIREEFI